MTRKNWGLLGSVGLVSILVSLWSLLLVFGHVLNWTTTPALGIAAWVASPPVAAFLLIKLGAIGTAKYRSKQATEQARAEAAEQKRREESDSHRAERERGHRERRIALVGLGIASALGATLDAVQSVVADPRRPTGLTPGMGFSKTAHDHVDYLSQGLASALSQLDLAVEAPLPFPIWLLVPAWLAEPDAHKLLRTVWRRLYRDEDYLPATVRLVPAGKSDSWMGDLFALFDGESPPGGVLVLAVDSPLRAARFGLPLPPKSYLPAISEAAVALLFSSRLPTPAASTKEASTVMPFWQQPTTTDAPTGMTSQVLTLLHRPAWPVTSDEVKDGLEQTLFNAGIASMPTDDERSAKHDSVRCLYSKRCEATRGPLLAALAAAGIQHDPVVGNVTAQEMTGEVGVVASSIALGMSALLTREYQKPAFVVHVNASQVQLQRLVPAAVLGE